MVEVTKMHFRYFHDPYAFSNYVEEPTACAICKQVAPGFEGPFRGDEQVSFICIDCLVTGKLQERGIGANLADEEALRAELRTKAAAGSPEEEIARIARERTIELTSRTPPLVTWQDLLWPVHCEDYCRFLKEAGKTDYRKLAAGKDPRAFFIKSLRDREKADEEFLWEGMRPDSPRDGSNPYSLAFYLFQCVGCGSYVSLWDEEQ